MYMDKQLLFSDAQVVTATAVSTNALDTGGSAPIRDIGLGELLRIVFTVGVTVTAAGAATVTFEVIQADDAALTTNVEVLASSAAIGKAALSAGVTFPFDVAVPRNTRRWVGVRYTIGTGPLTAGTFTTGIVHDRDARINYASGYPNAY